MIPTSVRKSPGKGLATVCRLWLWCYTSWHPLAACWKTTQEMVVKDLDDLSEGDSTRTVGYCGHPWQELDRGLLNGVFQCYEAQKERHTYTQGGLTCPLKMWLVKHWTKWSSLGKRWNVALRGFPWGSLWTILNPPAQPPPLAAWKAKQYQLDVYILRGRGCWVRNELRCFRVGQLMVLA